MLRFIGRRLLIMIPTLVVISIVSFVIIQLPPGDFLTTIEAQLLDLGGTITVEQQAYLDSLRRQYALDQPIHVQYAKWIGGVVRGDFGFSFEWRRPVSGLIWERLGLTLAVTGTAMIFTWVLAFPIGFYSAIKQHSLGDYIATFVGFVGLATPNFMFALLLLYFAFRQFGVSAVGLFSAEYASAPWSWAKFIDLLQHIWIPAIVVGTAQTAGLIRVMRNNLLDELKKPYVVTARAKGVSEFRLLLKYPVRIALNPFFSTVGWMLPQLISGVVITAVVLNLPTAGPMLLRALMSQDMYLAGAFVLLLSSLTVIGTLVSDLILAAMDPRIRYD